MSKLSKKASASLPAINTLRSGVQILDPDSADIEVCVAIVAAQFNGAIVDRLVDGAIATLNKAGIASPGITLVRVPGAWELPVVASSLAQTMVFDGVIALGCVIRGETAHFDVIANESARGLMQVALEHDMPVTNGVLACENEQQAIDRAGGAHGNKGSEAAQALLDTLAVLTSIDASFGGVADDLDALDLDEDMFR
jgi:6,7-dimethyl-8-ribityllumazine synthase